MNAKQEQTVAIAGGVSVLLISAALVTGAPAWATVTLIALALPVAVLATMLVLDRARA